MRSGNFNCVSLCVGSRINRRPFRRACCQSRRSILPLSYHLPQSFWCKNLCQNGILPT